MLLKARPEDFLVEELAAYEPSGKGSHVFVTIEKTGLTTADVVSAIAAALGVDARDIGTAGLKDKHAIAIQRLSLPPPVTPEAALALALPGVRVLAAARHEHKLKTGHLRGNRFAIRVRDARISVADAAARLAALARPPGLPNLFGEQRFGRDNAAKGRKILQGERVTADGRLRRLLVSAWQSELFNRYLERRLAAGAYARVIDGDILKKVGTGGVFATVDPAADQPRLDAGEIAPTGPMFGVEMRAPAPGTEAARLEDALLAEEGVTAAELRGVAKIAEGTRRPLGVPIDAPSVEADGDALLLRFALPAGAYATVVAELVCGDDPPFTLHSSPPC